VPTQRVNAPYLPVYNRIVAFKIERWAKRFVKYATMIQTPTRTTHEQSPTQTPMRPMVN